MTRKIDELLAGLGITSINNDIGGEGGDKGLAPATEGATVEDDDDNFVVPLDEVDENAKFPVIPRGTYACTIASCEFGYSQNGGNPMWTLQLEVDGGEYAGSKLYSHWTWAGKALPRSKKHLMSVAPDVAAMVPFKPKVIADQGVMLGKKCRAQVDIRKYLGDNRNNVKGILPADGSANTGNAFL